MIKLRGNPAHRVTRPGHQYLGQFPVFWGLERDVVSGEYKPIEFEVNELEPSGARLLNLARKCGAFEIVQPVQASGRKAKSDE